MSMGTDMLGTLGMSTSLPAWQPQRPPTRRNLGNSALRGALSLSRRRQCSSPGISDHGLPPLLYLQARAAMHYVDKILFAVYEKEYLLPKPS